MIKFAGYFDHSTIFFHGGKQRFLAYSVTRWDILRRTDAAVRSTCALRWEERGVDSFYIAMPGILQRKLLIINRILIKMGCEYSSQRNCSLK